MGEPSEALQFDRAESATATTGASAGPGGRCMVCTRAFDGAYFEISGKITCRSCKDSVERTLSGPLQGRVVLRALGWGLLGAVAGSTVFFAVRAITGYELGLVGIAVGLLVGYGVRKGSLGRGGWFYQAMAMILTYLAIVSTYIPSALRELGTGESASAPFLVKFAFASIFALLAPFLSGIQNIMGLAIIGFSLYEAWKLNRRVVLDIKGPFAIGR